MPLIPLFDYGPQVLQVYGRLVIATFIRKDIQMGVLFLYIHVPCPPLLAVPSCCTPQGVTLPRFLRLSAAGTD